MANVKSRSMRLAFACALIFGARTAAAIDPTYEVSAGQTQTVSQPITDGPGAVSVTKTGAGTLDLTGTNSYSGGTTISAGTLNANNSAAFGSGVVTVQPGATIGLQGVQIGNALVLNGAGIDGNGALIEGGINRSIISGAVTLGSDTTIAVPGVGGGAYLEGPVSGAFSLTKTGSGTLTVYSQSFNTGNVVIAAGTMYFGGSGLAGATFTVLPGASLTIGGNGTFNSTLILNGAGDTASGNDAALNLPEIATGFRGGFVVPNTLTGPITLASDTTISAELATISGVISGPGNLTIIGPGSMTFLADNTYTGATTISPNATLQIGAGGSTGSIVSPNVSVGSNAILAFDRSDTVTYGGAISGSGSLRQSGPGTLILNGNSSAFTGVTTIADGTLEVGDASHSGAVLGGRIVNVSIGTTLMGHGTVGGDVSNTGTVRPGGSVGVLTIAGNYQESSAATLTIEITPNVTAGPGVGYSQLSIGGTASLAGTLAIIDDPGTYFVGSRYTILTAAGGRSGTFATVSYDPGLAAYITPVVSYDSTNVFLTLDPTPGIGGPPLLFNGGQQIPDALTAMSSAAQGVGDAVLGDVCGPEARRLVTQGEGCVVRPLTAGYQAEVWLRALGGLGSLTGSGSRLSFNNDYGGTLIGVGVTRGAFTLGAGGGFLGTSLHFSDGSAASQNAGVGFVYGRYVQGPWSLGAVAAYGGGQMDGSRALPGTGLTASGNRSGNFVIVQTRAAYDASWNDFTIEPRVGLSYIHAGQAGFAESGAGLLDLTYAGTHSDELVGRATLRAMRQFAAGTWQVAPWIEGGVQESFTGLSRGVVVTDGAFSAGVSGVSPAPTAALLGVGVDVAASNAIDMFLRYQGQLSGNQVENAFSAGFTYRF